MGAVDLVIQVESPPWVASGLQRVGRAGHQVGAVSRGVLFPKYRGDLVQTAVVVERMRAGADRGAAGPGQPARRPGPAGRRDGGDGRVVGRRASRRSSAAPRPSPSSPLGARGRPRHAGRPLPERRVRRAAPAHRLGPRRRARSPAGPARSGWPSPAAAPSPTAACSASSWPAARTRAGRAPGRRARRGDGLRVAGRRRVRARLERLADRGHHPRPGAGHAGARPAGPAAVLEGRRAWAGRPSWAGRSARSSASWAGSTPAAARARVAAAGLDAWAADNLLGLPRRAARGDRARARRPHDRGRAVPRRARRLAGRRPLPLRRARCTRPGRWPSPPGCASGTASTCRRCTPTTASCCGCPTPRPRTSPVAARRRRPGAVRARRDRGPRHRGGRRVGAVRRRGSASAPPGRCCCPAATPAGARRCGSSASGPPSCWRWPASTPRSRSCSRRCASACRTSTTCRRWSSCMRGSAAPRGPHRRGRDAPAVAVRPQPAVRLRRAVPLRGRLAAGRAPGRGAGARPGAARRAARPRRGELRELLDPDVVARIEAELQRLTPDAPARDVEGVADLLRVLGPLAAAEVAARQRRPAAAPHWLAELDGRRRLIRVRIAGEERWAAIEDAGRLRDALGTPLPVGVPEAFLEPGADPLGDLVAATPAPTARSPLTTWPRGSGSASRSSLDALRRLVAAGRLVEGEFRRCPRSPAEPGRRRRPGRPGVCDAEVLRTLRRRSLAALRAEVEPVPAARWPASCPPGSTSAARLRGTRGRAAGRSSSSPGAPLPACALESLVLPARVADYAPALLDELTSAGEVIWAGHGALPGDDGWVSLHLADTRTADPARRRPRARADRAPRGAARRAGRRRRLLLPQLWPQRSSSRAGRRPTPTSRRAVGPGLGGPGHQRHPRAAARPARRRPHGPPHAHRPPGPRPLRRVAAGPRVVRRVERGRPAAAPPAVAGRWSLLPDREADPTVRAHAMAEVLLDRTASSPAARSPPRHVPGGFAAVYRCSPRSRTPAAAGAATSSRARRRAVRRRRRGRPAARAEPSREPSGRPRSRPAGSTSAPWSWPPPTRPTRTAPPCPGRRGRASRARSHRPGRKAGALVVLVDGALALYVERGGRTLLSWSEDPEQLQAAADALALAVHAARSAG